MRPAELTREAWRNVLTGTARAGLLAFALVVVVVGAGVLDLLQVRAITTRADEFRASGADVLVLDAAGHVDPVRCELLAGQPGIEAAGAMRAAPVRRLAPLPQDAIPAFEVTPGLPALLAPSDPPRGTGVVLSSALATTLGTETGRPLLTDAGATTIAGVYEYPDDGRRYGYSYALLDPVTPSGAFDSCWIRQWPANGAATTLLMTALTAGADDPSLAPPQISQLNPTLGITYDATSAFRERGTRWAPLGAFALAAAVGWLATWLRRLELATALHLGQSRPAQIVGLWLETAAWIAPSLAATLLTAAVAAARAPAGDLRLVVLLAALPAAAAAIGALAGVTLAASTARQRLWTLVKER